MGGAGRGGGAAVTAGSCALRLAASCVRCRGVRGAASAGAENMRRAGAPHAGQHSWAAAAPIGRAISKLPQLAHSYA